jgi:anti-anti-sigma factor
MFSFTFNRTMSNLFTNPNTIDLKQQPVVDTSIALESRLARKGLMLGLSMEQDTVKMYLVGKLNAGTSPIFKELLKNFLGHQYKSFVFDLSGLETLDGSGVATMVWAHNQMLEFGGRVSVTNPNNSICSKLLAVNFHHLVDIENFSLSVSAR